MNLRRSVSAVLLLLALLLAVGPVRRRAYPIAPAVSLVGTPESPELLTLRHEGNNLFAAGKYLAAIQVYERGYREAQRRKDARSALRFLNNLGSTNFQLLRYRDAVKAYLPARALASSQGNQETLVAICFNLSSLYYQMGEIDAATESAKRGLEVPVGASAKFRSKLLIQSALIEMSQKHWDRATAWIREAIEVSRAQLDVAAEAQAWNELGNALKMARLWYFRGVPLGSDMVPGMSRAGRGPECRQKPIWKEPKNIYSFANGARTNWP